MDFPISLMPILSACLVGVHYTHHAQPSTASAIKQIKLTTTTVITNMD